MQAPVTIIVLTHNNLEDTVECIDSVLRSRFSDFQVVLVDNHSTDGSIEKLRTRYPAIYHVSNERNLGVAGGRNAGWRYACEYAPAELLLFLDNDTVLTPDALGELVKYTEQNPDADVLCAKCYTAPPSTTIMSAGMSINLYSGAINDLGSGEKDIGQYDAPTVVAACGGFGFLVKQSVFEACGGLDESYNPYGWEDVDFCLRARKKGYTCYYVPSAVMYHKGCKIGRGYVAFYEKYKTKHYFLLLSRHTTGVQKLALAATVPMRGILMLVALIVRGDGRIALSQLAGLVEMLVAVEDRTRKHK